jgi:hypothetical protein
LDSNSIAGGASGYSSTMKWYSFLSDDRLSIQNFWYAVTRTSAIAQD